MEYCVFGHINNIEPGSIHILLSFEAPLYLTRPLDNLNKELLHKFRGASVTPRFLGCLSQNGTRTLEVITTSFSFMGVPD